MSEFGERLAVGMSRPMVVGVARVVVHVLVLLALVQLWVWLVPAPLVRLMDPVMVGLVARLLLLCWVGRWLARRAVVLSGAAVQWCWWSARVADGAAVAVAVAVAAQAGALAVLLAGGLLLVLAEGGVLRDRVSRPGRRVSRSTNRRVVTGLWGVLSGVGVVCGAVSWGSVPPAVAMVVLVAGCEVAVFFAGAWLVTSPVARRRVQALWGGGRR